MKVKLSGKILKELVGLRAKTYSYIKDDSSENKKAKDAKKCVINKDYKNCLQESQLEKKVYLEKSKIDVENFKENHKEFIKNNEIILKYQQRFKSERHNDSTEVINKIALCSNDDEMLPSIDLVEVYAYETSKNLLRMKEKIKCNNITKQDKND